MSKIQFSQDLFGFSPDVWALTEWIITEKETHLEPGKGRKKVVMVNGKPQIVTIDVLKGTFRTLAFNALAKEAHTGRLTVVLESETEKVFRWDDIDNTSSISHVIYKCRKAAPNEVSCMLPYWYMAEGSLHENGFVFVNGQWQLMSETDWTVVRYPYFFGNPHWQLDVRLFNDNGAWIGGVSDNTPEDYVIFEADEMPDSLPVSEIASPIAVTFADGVIDVNPELNATLCLSFVASPYNGKTPTVQCWVSLEMFEGQFVSAYIPRLG